VDLRIWDRESEDPRQLSQAGVEVWCEVEATLGFYYVSNLGRFASCKTRRRGAPPSKTPRLLRGSSGQNGYLMYTIFGVPGREPEKQNILAHRLVITAFEGGPSKPEQQDVRHRDNPDKADNRLCNLAWGTRSENMLDVWRHKRAGKGSLVSSAEPQVNPTYALDDHLVQVGLELHDEGKLSVADLCRLWVVSREVAAPIVAGTTWTHLARKAPAKQKRRSAVRKKEIRDLVEAGLNAAQINERLGENLTAQAVYYYRKKPSTPPH
jgi:hypothetical protein